MDPHHPSRSSSAPGLPRPRGDGPMPHSFLRLLDRAPPPTRGWTPFAPMYEFRCRGSPAHAGMDPLRVPRAPKHNRLPRPRGDGPPGWRACGSTKRASPPKRGWTPVDREIALGKIGSPAHAGMDPSTSPPPMPPPGLPRPRGDGPPSMKPTKPFWPAPPSTRGWTQPVEHQPRWDSGSPAHAGMDPTWGR